LNRSGHTIVDDEFLFVKDSSIRLWEHKIRGNHLPIHMFSDFWTTRKIHVRKDVWNISIISIYGLVHYHQNTKQFSVEFPVTKDTKTLKQQQKFSFECIDHISEDINVKVMSITCIGFIQK
jgi:hypothetical protein